MSAPIDAGEAFGQLHGLPEAHIEHLRFSFSLFDTDGEGSIDTEEFVRLMAALGLDVSTEEASDMLATVDADGSGRLEFEDHAFACPAPPSDDLCST